MGISWYVQLLYQCISHLSLVCLEWIIKDQRKTEISSVNTKIPKSPVLNPINISSSCLCFQTCRQFFFKKMLTKLLQWGNSKQPGHVWHFVSENQRMFKVTLYILLALLTTCRAWSIVHEWHEVKTACCMWMVRENDFS